MNVNFKAMKLFEGSVNLKNILKLKEFMDG